MEPLIIMLLVGAVAALIYFAVMGPIERRRKLGVVAGQMGLQFSAADPFGMLRLPFPLFRRGDGRGIENVIWGERQGHEVWGFDYWYYEESSDSKGRRSRSTSRFNCSLTELPARAPHTSVGPESLFTRLADLVGFRDIDFESEEFNRAMQVKSQDQRFATYLIDARMMEWLLETRGWTFELFDRYLLCVRKRLRPEEVPTIIEAVLAFRERIPNVVFETYGSH
jgi:hypothetical protein